ncbi:MAG: fluoride efflux transporter FluC [Nocardioides sp.]|uniref:fluoride efflux transporter FluC n=1 Tax=Nocardioides sp. TaxID=35761 RepID=UPI003F0B7879
MSGLLVALGAAVGAPLRYLCARRWDTVWPLGTWLVNVVGSALLGLFLGLSLDGAWWALLGTGFCGGLTSYSAFAVHAVDLPLRPSAVYVAATVAGSLAACAAGLGLGLLL